MSKNTPTDSRQSKNIGIQAIANSINGTNGSNGNKTAVAIVVIPKPAIPYLQLVV